MSAIQLSGTRFAALAVLARPKNDADEPVDFTLKALTDAGSITLSVPSKHPGGGTIDEMRKAAGWSEGAAKGTIPVYRQFGFKVVMTKDADGKHRYQAVVPESVQIMNTGRGHWKNSTKPSTASDVSTLPGNPGNAAVDQVAAAAEDAAVKAVEAIEAADKEVQDVQTGEVQVMPKEFVQELTEAGIVAIQMTEEAVPAIEAAITEAVGESVPEVTEEQPEAERVIEAESAEGATHEVANNDQPKVDPAIAEKARKIAERRMRRDR